MGSGSSSVSEGVTANPRLVYTDSLSKRDKKVSRQYSTVHNHVSQIQARKMATLAYGILFKLKLFVI
jgi:hypothetical protein